jgi:pyruvate/2-oxoglutarate dehydrogenase complex dihydrolipoamide acyltransferase (E2) component
MAVKVIFQKSGMGIEEGTIVRWLKAEGEAVNKGDVLVEIETAKAVVEVEAKTSGTLSRIIAEQGQEVSVNAEIALIEEMTLRQ